MSSTVEPEKTKNPDSFFNWFETLSGRLTLLAGAAVAIGGGTLYVKANVDEYLVLREQMVALQEQLAPYRQPDGTLVLGQLGPKGDPGSPGKDGIDGTPGTPGLDGENGPPGQDGAQGPPGEPGADGLDGAQGSRGLNGNTGPTGSPGADGKDGLPGLNGTDGRNVELQVEGTWLQWRLVGDAAWINLTDLKGLAATATSSAEPVTPPAPQVQNPVAVARFIVSPPAPVADVLAVLKSPPLSPTPTTYSLSDASHNLSTRMLLGNVTIGITFDSGAATIARAQAEYLGVVAQAMLALIRENPNEKFLIESHTNDVGSEQSNMTLSQARALTISKVLHDFFDVPEENLVPVGFGEAEGGKRRFVIRRLTLLLAS